MGTSTSETIDGREFIMREFTGEVLENRAWSETETYSTTSHSMPMHLGNNNWSASVPTTNIHSDTTNKLEFWLKNSDGKETDFTISNRNVKLRVGHVVTVYYGHFQGATSSPLFKVVNHTTNESRDLFMDDGKRVVKLLQDAGLLIKPGFLLNAFIMVLLFSIILIPVLIIFCVFDHMKTIAKVKDLKGGVSASISSLKPNVAREVELLMMRKGENISRAT